MVDPRLRRNQLLTLLKKRTYISDNELYEMMRSRQVYQVQTELRKELERTLKALQNAEKMRVASFMTQKAMFMKKVDVREKGLRYLTNVQSRLNDLQSHRTIDENDNSEDVDEGLWYPDSSRVDAESTALGDTPVRVDVSLGQPMQKNFQAKTFPTENASLKPEDKLHEVPSVNREWMDKIKQTPRKSIEVTKKVDDVLPALHQRREKIRTNDADQPHVEPRRQKTQATSSVVDEVAKKMDNALPVMHQRREKYRTDDTNHPEPLRQQTQTTPRAVDGPVLLPVPSINNKSDNSRGRTKYQKRLVMPKINTESSESPLGMGQTKRTGPNKISVHTNSSFNVDGENRNGRSKSHDAEARALTLPMISTPTTGPKNSNHATDANQTKGTTHGLKISIHATDANQTKGTTNGPKNSVHDADANQTKSTTNGPKNSIHAADANQTKSTTNGLKNSIHAADANQTKSTTDGPKNSIHVADANQTKVTANVEKLSNKNAEEKTVFSMTEIGLGHTKSGDDDRRETKEEPEKADNTSGKEAKREIIDNDSKEEFTKKETDTEPLFPMAKLPYLRRSKSHPTVNLRRQKNAMMVSQPLPGNLERTVTMIFVEDPSNSQKPPKSQFDFEAWLSYFRRKRGYTQIVDEQPYAGQDRDASCQTDKTGRGKNGPRNNARVSFSTPVYPDKGPRNLRGKSREWYLNFMKTRRNKEQSINHRGNYKHIPLFTLRSHYMVVPKIGKSVKSSNAANGDTISNKMETEWPGHRHHHRMRESTDQKLQRLKSQSEVLQVKVQNFIYS